MPPSNLQIHLALLTVSSIYAIFYIIIKLLLQEIGQAELILMRFVLTGLIAVGIDFILGRSKITSTKTVFQVMGTGVVGVFLVQIFLIIGLNLTTTFHSALIMATVPILTMAFGILMKREVFNKQRLIGILLAFFGVAILLAFKPSNEVLPPYYLEGDILVMIAACAFAWFLLASKRLLTEIKPFSLMAYSYLFSALAFAGVFWVGAAAGHHELSYDFLVEMSPNGWWMLFYVVIFASIGTYTLNNFALKHTRPSMVAGYIFFQPILTAFLGTVVLKEAFYWDMIIAAGMTFAGVMIATISPDGPDKGFSAPKKAG